MAEKERELGHTPRTVAALEDLVEQEKARGERPAPEAGKVSRDTDPEFLHPQHGEGEASSASSDRE